jgi:hypothetical protein
MTTRLSGPLGSWDDRDEFQIGTTLVWVNYTSAASRDLQLSKAEALLPALERDVSTVEELVRKTVGSSVGATVAGIAIRPDGSSTYQCTFFGGDHEDEFFSVERKANGDLSIEPYEN